MANYLWLDEQKREDSGEYQALDGSFKTKYIWNNFRLKRLKIKINYRFNFK
jgi:hypothetical protein